MMAHIWSISQAKGSQGKTTTAVHMAVGLAKHGRRVLLVGTDTQQHCAAHLGAAVDMTLYDLYTGAAFGDVATEVRPSLYLIAGGEPLSRLKREMNAADHRVEWQLHDLLTPALPYFTDIIIDTSPGWDLLGLNTVYAADSIIVPVTLEPLAMNGMRDHLRRIARYAEYGGGALRYILPTLVDMRKLQSREIMGQLREQYAAVLCDPIRTDIRLSESPAHGQTIWEYAPKSRSADDYTKFMERVINEQA